MTTKTQQEVTPQQRIAILKHLATGKDLDTVAAIMRGIDRDAIGEIARHHGWPDTGKLSWAVDVLVKKQEEADQAGIPAGTPDGVGVTIVGRPSTSSPSSVTSPTSRPGSGPDEIRVLLNTAKSHPSKRIQTAADRVFDHLDKLRALLRDDEQKHAARRRADAEKAAARAEVDRLKAELAAAQEKLRGPAKPKPAKPAHAVEGDEPSAKTIRAWAAETDLDCPTRGQLPKAIRDAYDDAHQAGAA